MARLKFIIAVTLLVLLLSLLALADSRPWDDHILCPKCKSDRVVYILYGEPKMGEDLPLCALRSQNHSRGKGFKE
jgi:hypothetical protein